MPAGPKASRPRRKRITLAEALVLLGILGALVIPMLGRSGARPEASPGTASERPAPIDEGPNAVDVPGEPAGFDDDRAADGSPSLAARLQVFVFVITAIVVTSLIGRELLRRRRR